MRATRGVMVTIGAVMALMTMASAAPPACAPPAAGDPVFLTDECVDAKFNAPSVDVDEQRTVPVPHRYIHGSFKGTEAKFSFYFPPAAQYEKRFFQGPTHQQSTSENASPDDIAFAIASGAYLVRTNQGGNGVTAHERAYALNAAAAKFSRIQAAQIYGPHRPYGYLHGPSGGAYQTVSGLENSTVWDGGVPTVMGSSVHNPLTYTPRVHAMRVLRINNRFPAIMDAIEPGGSGDMYAGLNAEERAALEEVTRIGFPPRGWWNHATLGAGAFPLVVGSIWSLDPTYVDDFWSKPGYLGTDPKSSIHAARIVHRTTVAAKVTSPNGLQLATFPTGNLEAIDLRIASGKSAGQILRAPRIDAGARAVTVPSSALYDSIQVGDQVALDNSAILAVQTYHRHQVGTPDFYPWNQFRKPDGTPIYPQRGVLVGPTSLLAGNAVRMNGKFHGKMIVVETLMDIDAIPWAADWYQKRVKDQRGSALDDRFRVYFHDNAQHGAPQGDAAKARTVSYTGVIQQALRDLSAWVERGVKPPASTQYAVVESQIEPRKSAAQRKGIQPVVELTVNGRARADVAAGQPVTFSAKIDVPPGTGKVVAAEWDFLGAGTYPVPAEIGIGKSAVTLKATHAYSQPGTYFAVLRATSQRDGDTRSPFGRIQNLGRVRVVVR